MGFDFLWILAGIIYIIYQGFKTDAATTGAILIFVIGIFLFVGINCWLIDVNLVVGSLSSIVSVGGLIYFYFRLHTKSKKEKKELRRKLADHDE